MLPSGIVTFLFTDIEGSTPLWERDPDSMRISLEQHHAILNKAITANGGQVIKIVGDEFQAVFVDPNGALAAALAGQRALDTAKWGTTGPLRVRMGLHLGHAQPQGDDYFTTHTLNRVARIMAAGHGGQILLSSDVASLVRRTLPKEVSLLDLGQQRMKGMQELEHLYQVMVPDLPSKFPPLKSLALQPSNLPLDLTPFIGRDKELADLTALLSQPEGRLITIIGPGGMGKTRLALACAAHFANGKSSLASPFPDGVFFVNLTPLSEPQHIVPAIAESINFPLQGGEQDKRPQRQQLLDYFRGKQLMLVMDNYEHLLAGAEEVAAILQAAPNVKIITTSRERLHLRLEQLYPIQGLEFPDWETPEDAETYTAVQLFLQSARRNLPSFELADSGDLTYLARICRLVAGMPLAIELAAAWVDTLPLAEIAHEIQAGLDLLETDMRDVPKRHRSIRAAIEYSWHRLSKEEQAAFAQLSVFRGGFSRQAGQAISGASLRLLARLVNKSFLQYHQVQERYALHELMRQFGAEQLAADAELERAVRFRHASYYCQALADRAADLKGPQQMQALADIEADGENVRTAWNWALQQRDAHLLDKARFALFRFYEWQGRFRDYQEAVTAAIVALDRTSATPAELLILVKLLHLKFDQTSSLPEKQRILDQTSAVLDQLAVAGLDVSDIRADDEFHRGLLYDVAGDYHQARLALESCLDYYLRTGKRWWELKSWLALGYTAMSQAHFSSAEEYAQQALHLAEALGDRWLWAESLHLMGYIANEKGEFKIQHDIHQKIIEISQELGLLVLRAEALMDLGTSFTARGRVGEALPYHEESLAIHRQIGDDRLISWNLQMLAVDTMFLEQFETAANSLQEGFEMAQHIQDLRGLSWNRTIKCCLSLITGKYDEALLEAQDSLAFAGAPGSRGVDTSASSSVFLGWSQLVHGQYSQAERSLYNALHMNNVWSRDAFLPIAYLLSRRFPTSQQLQRAWQLIGLAGSASVWQRNPLFVAFVERFQPPELLNLPAEEIKAAKLSGRSLDPATVVAELIEELPPLGWGELPIE